jgi:hypothetical protein
MVEADVIDSCRRLLCEDYSYFLVIDGIMTKDAWDSIKETFFSEHIKGRVLAISYDIFVVLHCVNKNHEVVNVMRYNGNVEREHPIKLLKFLYLFYVFYVYPI